MDEYLKEKNQFEKEWEKHQETLDLLKKIDIIESSIEVLEEYIIKLISYHDLGNKGFLDKYDYQTLAKIFKGHSDYRLNDLGQEILKKLYMKVAVMGNVVVSDNSPIVTKDSLIKPFIEKINIINELNK
jgi:hypothetical protein